MWKEAVICIVIVLVIIIGNIGTQNYTVESVKVLSEKLQDLKMDVTKLKDQEEASEETKNKMEAIQEEWSKRHDRLAYFIEHDELEKVENNLIGMDSYVESGEYAEAISELDKGVFILRHIEEKYAFKLENVF